MATYEDVIVAESEDSGVNPLQRVMSEAMARAGMPLEQRGSKAELARRSGVSMTVIGYLFNRESYLPDAAARAGFARALGIPKSDLDQAGAELKGLRVHSATVSDRLADVTADLILAEDELSAAELRRAQRELDRLAEMVAERLKGSRPKG